jgi:MFS family permease
VPPNRRTVVLALGASQTVAWGSSYYLPAILAEPMARDLGLAPPWVFGAFSAALVLSALLGPWVGRAIDRRGGRPVLASSNGVLALGLCLLAAAHGPGTLAAAWLVLGAGIALGLYDAAFATLAGLYGREARGAITGVTLVAGFASTVGWPLSAAFEGQFGWRGACLAWAGLNLALALPLNLLLVPRAPPPHRAAAAAEGEAATAPPPRFAAPLLAFVFAAVWFTTGAMAAHLPGLLRAAGAGPAEAVAAAALLGPAQVAARLAEFGLLRRAHPLVSARLATLGHPTGVLALLLVPGGGAAAAAFAVLHGAGNGVMTVARGTLPLAVFGPAGYGARQGLIGAPARLLQALAPFAFGWLLEGAGVGAALAVTSGLSLAALAALLALRPIGAPSRPPPPRSEPPETGPSAPGVAEAPGTERDSPKTQRKP